MNMIIAVAVGGALGSVARYILSGFTTDIVSSSFPWGTLSVNVLGSFLMGAVVTYMALVWNPNAEMRAFLTVGLLGGFTTFSLFSLDIINLWERGASMAAMGYIIASIIVSLLAIILGIMIVKAIIS